MPNGPRSLTYRKSLAFLRKLIVSGKQVGWIEDKDGLKIPLEKADPALVIQIVKKIIRLIRDRGETIH